MKLLQKLQKNFLFFLLWSCITHPTSLFAFENVFYILHHKNQQQLQATIIQLKQHKKAIQMIISQAYQIDSRGKLSGYLNQEVVDLAKNKTFKLMAMITNKAYDQHEVRQFLSSTAAQDKAISAILAACKQNNLYGVQFDFEMISIHDKEALTRFYQKAALALHKQNYAVSFAVVPAFAEGKNNSLFLKRTFENWSGAYDLKALGESADFITIMAYNQHPEGTMPGPNAGIVWVNTAIKNTLRFIPAHKISLGIPAYSLYWFTGASYENKEGRVLTHRIEMSYFDAMHVIKKNHAHLVWNKKNKVNYSIYERNWLNEYIYLEDSASFKSKLALVNNYHLRGISVFRIGTEDTRIWALMHKEKRLS